MNYVCMQVYRVHAYVLYACTYSATLHTNKLNTPCIYICNCLHHLNVFIHTDVCEESTASYKSHGTAILKQTLEQWDT